MHSTCSLVIGNGESRKFLFLQKYTGKITMIGCNAVHRDAIVDHLICCDFRMVNEALQNVNNCNTLIYTRKEHINKFLRKPNLVELPDIPYQQINRIDYDKNWGSGPYSLLVAANLSFENYYIIGFDLYSKNNKINNIYKDTKNYSPSTDQAIDPSYWIYQNAKIFEIYSSKKFIIVNENDWIMPKEWQMPNVDFLELNSLDCELQIK